MNERPAALYRIYDVIRQSRSASGAELIAPANSDGAVQEGVDGDPDPSNTIARLHGVVTAARKGGRDRRFLDLLDPTGTLQLAADKNYLGDEAWEELLKIGRGDRIYAEGYIAGVSRSGQVTVNLVQAPMPAQPLNGTLQNVRPDYRGVGQRIFISRIRGLVEQWLSAAGYLRLEVRMLSATWNESTEVGLLRILYPGFGLPVYVAPSPGPQLIEAMIATGENRVFASTASFMTGYRGPSDGVESAFVTARTLGVGLDELVLHGSELLYFVASEMGVAREDPFKTQVYSTADGVEDLDMAANEVQILAPSEERASPSFTTAFRIVQEAGVSPVEGAVEVAEDGVPLGTLNVYVERCLQLVSHLPIRRLEHLDRSDRD